jgi:hypothetical protein
LGGWGLEVITAYPVNLLAHARPWGREAHLEHFKIHPILLHPSDAREPITIKGEQDLLSLPKLLIPLSLKNRGHFLEKSLKNHFKYNFFQEAASGYFNLMQFRPGSPSRVLCLRRCHNLCYYELSCVFPYHSVCSLRTR